jgi:hypothetical protein
LGALGFLGAADYLYHENHNTLGGATTVLAASIGVVALRNLGLGAEASHKAIELEAEDDSASNINEDNVIPLEFTSAQDFPPTAA